jgi:hypothetical protein
MTRAPHDLSGRDDRHSALKPIALGVPMLARKLDPREFEYRRRGTLATLIPTFDVTAGKVEGVVGRIVVSMAC